MTTYYDLHCNTCDCDAGISGHRGCYEMLELVQNRTLVVAAQHAIEGLYKLQSFYPENLQLRLEGDQNWVDVGAWFVEHYEHDIEVRNECGRTWSPEAT